MQPLSRTPIKRLAAIARGSRLLAQWCLTVGCAGLLLSTALGEEKYALLVGVENYPNGPLAGVNRDLSNMERLLTNKFGFPARNVKVIRDKGATLEGVRTAFANHLLRQAKPEDVVVFYFAGHGTQVPDLNGDEEEGLDEVLVVYDHDVKKKRFLVDDEVAGLLGRIKAGRVFCVFDCCHSGTATRAMGELGTKVQARYLPSGFELMELDKRNLPQASQKGAWRDPIAKGHTIISACADTEVALGGEAGGLFTSAMVNALTVAPQRSANSLKDELVSKVSDAAMKSEKHQPQTPQFAGELDSGLFGMLAQVELVKIPTPIPIPVATNAPDPLTIYKDFRVQLRVDKEQYRSGEVLTATVNCDEDCYLRLYHMNAKGAMTLVFPNAYQTNGFVKKGQSVQLPPSPDMFKFRVSEPKLDAVLSSNGGKSGIAPTPPWSEVLRAIASTTPFTDVPVDPKSKGGSPFRSLPRETLARAAVRDLEVEAGDPPIVPVPIVIPKVYSGRRGSDFVIYQVLPKQ